MCALMCYQTALLTECLITHITNIRALTTMYTRMPYQITLVTEYLITHITNIRALTSRYALMTYQTALFTERFITHITNVRALTSMYALMCCLTLLMTVCPLTHFTCVWMLTPMYITRISALTIVYIKLYIRSILVKTQRLNIRIYSDRKNNYFYSNVYSKQKFTTFEELCY